MTLLAAPQSCFLLWLYISFYIFDDEWPFLNLDICLAYWELSTCINELLQMKKKMEPINEKGKHNSLDFFPIIKPTLMQQVLHVNLFQI